MRTDFMRTREKRDAASRRAFSADCASNVSRKSVDVKIKAIRKSVTEGYGSSFMTHARSFEIALLRVFIINN